MSVKSLLTNEQIEEICTVIPLNKGVPVKVGESIRKKIITDLRLYLKDVKIYKEVFEKFKQEIEKNYHKSLCAPGEAVGILCAMSIGERQTQTTLNSVDWKEELLFIENGISRVSPIGIFIDELLAENKEHIEYYPDNGNTEYLQLPKGLYQVPTLDECGRTSWKNIEAITRHLPGGNLVRVFTESGRTVDASKGKSFLVWDHIDYKYKATNGSDLKIGDILPTTRFLYKPDFMGLLEPSEKSFERGFFTGHQQSIPDTVYIGSRSFIKGFISGYLNFNAVRQDHKIIIKNRDESSAKGIQFLLSYFGICGAMVKACKKTENFTLLVISGVCLDDEFVVKDYKTSPDVLISDYIQGCGHTYLDKIIKIEEVASTKGLVYDLTVEETRNFILFNGLGCADTFHSSGMNIKSVTVGVPRFSEMLSATKNPKIVNCLIYLNETRDNVNEVRDMVGRFIPHINIKRLSKKIKYIPPGNLEDWHKLFLDFFKVEVDIDELELSPRVRLEINKEILFEYKLTMKQVASKIKEEYEDAIVLYTPEHDSTIDIFIDGFNADSYKSEDVYEEEPVEEVSDTDEVSDTSDSEVDEDEVEPVVVPLELETIIDRVDPLPDGLEVVEYIEDKVIPNLENVLVSGIPGIKEVFYEKKGDEWVITTEGSNLRQLFCDPLVDKYKTICNNMWEIYEIFGIEATRTFLIEEYIDVVSSDGTFVNPCHVELLVDIMCNTGTILSISRYGQKKLNVGPLGMCSFEESLENLLKCSIHGEEENTKGVSASIILGKIPKTGTGVFDLMIDMDSLVEKKAEIKAEIKTEIKAEIKAEIKTHKPEEKTDEKVEVKVKPPSIFKSKNTKLSSVGFFD